MNDMNKPILHNVPNPTITVEWFENAIIEHLKSEQFKKLHRLIEYDMKRLDNACEAFFSDCLERHPEILQDLENTAIERTDDGVNVIYHGAIIGIMKWGMSI